MSAPRPPRVRRIGWREFLALPDLGIPRIKVKIDTGAKSSALHAFNVERFRRRGKIMVRFAVQPLQRSTKKVVVAEAEMIDERVVRSSNGVHDLRPVIVTTVEILGQKWPIELTLASRDAMGFRMLLGRQALVDRFLIDPGRSYVAGRPKRKARPLDADGADVIKAHVVDAEPPPPPPRKKRATQRRPGG
jgi:hypothetical protein